ncbi:MAG: hypothetical protein FJ096_19925 [Deltaproteobacteria bacterium]|nr:hypothetical protein [Deltaproteobacteria bacterium]
MTTRAFASLLFAGVVVLATTPALAAANQVDDEQSEGDDDDDRPPPTSPPPILGFALHAGSMWLAEARGLAQFGRSERLGELSRVASLVEPSLTLTFDRFVLPFRGRFASTLSREGLDVDTMGGAIGGGYLILRRPDIALFPSVSLGVLRTRAAIGSSDEPARPATFDSLARAGGPTVLSAVSVIAEAAIDAQFRMVGSDAATRGLYVGVRAGLTASLGQSDWLLEHNRVADFTSAGPRAPVSGPFVTASLSARF